MLNSLSLKVCRLQIVAFIDQKDYGIFLGKKSHLSHHSTAQMCNYLYCSQWRSQNLKAVPQNFMENFKVDDVTTNDVILKKKQRRLRKEKLHISHSNHYC